MAISRNARRAASKCRKALAETDRHNTALAKARAALVRDNLSKPQGRRERSNGLVATIYSGAAAPVSAGRSKKFSHGAAKYVGTKPRV